MTEKKMPKEHGVCPAVQTRYGEPNYVQHQPVLTANDEPVLLELANIHGIASGKLANDTVRLHCCKRCGCLYIAGICES